MVNVSSYIYTPFSGSDLEIIMLIEKKMKICDF